MSIYTQKNSLPYRFLSTLISVAFASNVVLPPQVVSAQMIPAVLNLPAVGAMVPLSSGFVPTMVTGITVHPENPLAFDFIIGTGDDVLDDVAFKEESRKLIKYFLATLTVPNQELWVNLSPYEKDRIVPESFGNTEMGRDMLAQDYILKQLSASLMYPEDELGKKFWDRVYTKAYQKYGTSEIPMNTFNKIWIVPQEAVVYEHGNSAFVVKSHLKVMLEEDYIALQNNMGITKYGLDSVSSNEAQVISGVTSEVVKEVLIPEIEKEVNEGETFANLRQIYNSVILATWYEQNLKGSLLGQLYVDRAKTKGIDNEDKEVNQKIYDQYVEAFKKGVYNYIKEDLDLQTQEVVPRKYFSGGTNFDLKDTITTVKSSSPMFRAYAGDIERIVSSPMKDVRINVVETGENVSREGINEAVAMVESVQERGAVSSPIKTIEIRTVDHLKQYLQENPFVVDATLEAFLRAIKDPQIQSALASGGLGYLAGDTYRGYGYIGERALGLMPLYEHYFDREGNRRIGIDWDNVDGVRRLLDVERGSQKSLRLDVEFNGNIYNVKVYLILEGTTPVIAVRQSEIFYALYPEEPGKLRQMAFLGRVYVELFKRLGAAPDILRLNEPQLFFLNQAMRNDIDYFNNAYFRQQGKRSIFADTHVQLTTHTPEAAALPVYTDKNWVRDNIDKTGKSLAPDDLFVDGVLNLAKRLATDPKVQIINAVSQEHREVTVRAVLSEGTTPEKTIGITNGSDRKVWTNPEILDIEDAGKEVQGEDLYQIGQRAKQKLNDYLSRRTGQRFSDLERPLVGLVRRLVEYKSQNILFGIVEYIVGDRDKQYDTPWGKRNGLGMNLLVGGVGRDDIGKEWVVGFKKLAERNDLKGKFIFLEGSDTEIMDLSAQASDVWVSMPRSTREAAGTSDQRAAFNGHLNIATATGGPAEYIEQGMNGWLMDVFKDSGYTFDEVIRFMELPNTFRDKKKVVDHYGKRSQELLAEYLQEASGIYDAYHEGRDHRWADMMRSSYEIAKDKLDIVRMVKQYSQGFKAIREGRVDAVSLQRLQKGLTDISSKSLVGSSPVVLRNETVEVSVRESDQKTNIVFGTNGAREEMYRIVGDAQVPGPFTDTYVARIANALARVALHGVSKGAITLKNPQEGIKVLVSYDARKKADSFAQTVYRAVSAYQGITVHMADGVTNSPDAAYQSSSNYDFVVQITASHNPENWNGLKLFTDGMVATDELARMIEAEANSSEGRAHYVEIPKEQIAITGVDVFQASRTRKNATFETLKEIVTAYRNSHPQAQMTADVMGGAATNYASEFKALGIEVIRQEPMSKVPYNNRDPGELYAPNPTIASNFGAEFDAFKSFAPDGSIYFGLDGDVDRLVVWVKHQGNAMEINPSALGMLYLDYLMSHKERIGEDLKDKRLVAGKTLPTTIGLNMLADKNGVDFVTVPVGSKNFRDALKEPGQIVVVATEESGHQVLTVGGETFFDDAVTQMYLVLEMVGVKNQNPVEMVLELRQRMGFDLEFANNAIALEDTIVEKFLKTLEKGPQVVIDILEAKIGARAEKIQVVTKDNKVVAYTPGVALDAAQGLHFTFRDADGRLSTVYVRKSGTEPKFRIYRESVGQNPELFKMGVDMIREAAVSSPVVSADQRLTIRDIPGEWYQGKVVAVRADLNVPTNRDGKITDDARIQAALPTVRDLLANGAKVVLISHLGDEKDFVSRLEKQYLKEGVPSEEAKIRAKAEGTRIFKERRSLRVVYERIRELLAGTNVYFRPEFVTTKEANGFLGTAVQSGEMLLLENVRFHKGEKKNDANFGDELFDGVDLIVTDAFGAAHRVHASMVGGASRQIPRVAGLLMQKETRAVDAVIERAGLTILGGSKVTDKIKVIRRLLEKPSMKHLLIGGAMANAFFAAEGRIPAGSAKGAEEEEMKEASKLLADPQARRKIILPSDVLAVDNFVNPKGSRVVDFDKGEQVPSGWVIVDIGPDTLARYETFINEVPRDRYIFWNGPMGVFDQEKLVSMGAENGTKGVTLALAALKGKTPVVIGGGDSGVAVAKYGSDKEFYHVSTGGGAFLEGLEKGASALPGVSALTERIVDKNHLARLREDVAVAFEYFRGEKLVDRLVASFGAFGAKYFYDRLPGVDGVIDYLMSKRSLAETKEEVRAIYQVVSNPQLPFTFASSPISFQGVSEQMGQKLLEVLPLTDTERNLIEKVEVLVGAGILYERHAYLIELGGKKIVVYLTPDVLTKGHPFEGMSFIPVSHAQVDELADGEIHMAQAGEGQFVGPDQLTVQEYENLIGEMLAKAGFFDNYRLMSTYILESKPIREQINDLSVFFATLHGRSDDAIMKKEYVNSLRSLSQRDDDRSRKGDMSQKRDYLSATEEKQLQSALVRAAMGELADKYGYITILNVVSGTRGIEDVDVMIVPQVLKGQEDEIQDAVRKKESVVEHAGRDYPIAMFKVDTKEGVITIVSAVSSPLKTDKEEVGGINLNPELLDLQIKRDGNGVPLPLPQQPIEHMRIDGFVPVIINITPVSDLPFLLGLSKGQGAGDELSLDRGLQPMDRMDRRRAREVEQLSFLN